MAPERSPKRQKTSANPETPSKTSESNQIPRSPGTPTLNLSSSTDPVDRQPQRSSWYSSWSRKAPPITQVARESIRSASSAASEVAQSIKDVSTSPRTVRSPSLAMTLGKVRSSRASLADATTTIVHAEAKSPATKPIRTTKSLSIASSDLPQPQDTKPKAKESEPEPSQQEQEPQQIPTTPKRETVQQEEQTSPDEQNAQLQRSSWLAWLATGDSVSRSQNRVPSDVKSVTDPTTDAVEEEEPPKLQAQEVEPTTAADEATVPSIQAGKRGWLQMWGAENNQTLKSNPTDAKSMDSSTTKPAPEANTKDTVLAPKFGIPQTGAQSKPSEMEASLPPALPHDVNKASAWAFWSRDRKANNSTSSIDKPKEGEIAVSDTPSQNQPRRASITVPKAKSELKPEPTKPEPKKSGNKQSETKKAEGTKRAEGNKAVESTIPISAPESSSTPANERNSKAEASTVTAESSKAKATAVEPVEAKKAVPLKPGKAAHNLLLPELHATLKIPESPSILLRLANLLYPQKEPELSHLSLVKDPPRIKNALAIGVHGYFPAPLIRSVLGQPTGTSIKFADMAAKSIKRWTTAHGYECQVKTAALEGEGKIADRLELLWKLLLNWIEEIRKSDFIMVACHSQGVPVAIMLVAKLIQFGCVNSARVSICAMAGVNMGPFPEYKSRWIGGSAGELFEFTDPSSRVSIDYLAALDVVLKFGVRLTFIGSIDDQLVSLESSIYSPLSHPHIFRAVSIDSRIHAPNFLSHLVGFALKLRNLGIQDHGLIRELSSPLAGSLYTGEGHSRIYEDDAVYDLAVAFAMETNSRVGLPLTQTTVVAGASNPYILPFAMRGILEEDFVKTELQGEASDLLKEFDDWKPTSKVLKDVKFRLEGIRSKL